MKNSIRIFWLIVVLMALSDNSANSQPSHGKLDWKFEAGGKIIGSASLLNNTLFFGSEDGTLYSLQTADGSLNWSKKMNGRIASKPAVAGSFLFVLSGNGVLHKLNAGNGDSIWVYNTEGEEHRFKRYTQSGETYEDIWDYYLSSPAIDNGIVFFGSSDRHVYAIDAETGKLKWKYKTGNVVHSDPVVDEGTVYVGSFDGFMYALDAEDGSLKWKFDTVGAAYFPEGAVQRGVTIHQEVLLFGSRDYNLYVLSKETGKGFYNFKADSWVIGSPAVHEGKVYFATSDSHLVYCKDIQDYSKLDWKTELPLRILSSPVAHNDLLYVGNFDGILYGLNKETGETEWQFKTGGHQKNYSAIFREDGTFQPGFSIYGNSIGETKANDEKMMALGSILATPVIRNNTIYFGSTDSTFYAVSLPE